MDEHGAPRYHTRVDTLEVWGIRVGGIILVYVAVLAVLAWAGVIR